MLASQRGAWNVQRQTAIETFMKSFSSSQFAYAPNVCLWTVEGSQSYLRHINSPVPQRIWNPVSSCWEATGMILWSKLTCSCQSLDAFIKSKLGVEGLNLSLTPSWTNTGCLHILGRVGHWWIPSCTIVYRPDIWGTGCIYVYLPRVRLILQPTWFQCCFCLYNRA